MVFSKDEIEKVLRDKRILIVNSDAHLSSLLAHLLKRYTGLELVVHGSVESGLKELNKEDLAYDVLIVDFKLPLNEADFHIVIDSQKQLMKLQKEIENIDKTNDDVKDREGSIYFAQEDFRQRIKDHIDVNAGMEMVETWVKEHKKKNNNILPATFVLFWSSIDLKSHGELKARFDDLRIKSEYLFQPAILDVILKKLAQGVQGN